TAGISCARDRASRREARGQRGVKMAPEKQGIEKPTAIYGAQGAKEGFISEWGKGGGVLSKPGWGLKGMQGVEQGSQKRLGEKLKEGKAAAQAIYEEEYRLAYNRGYLPEWGEAVTAGTDLPSRETAPAREYKEMFTHLLSDILTEYETTHGFKAEVPKEQADL